MTEEEITITIGNRAMRYRLFTYADGSALIAIDDNEAERAVKTVKTTQGAIIAYERGKVIRQPAREWKGGFTSG
jgi:hypothetical protein